MNEQEQGEEDIVQVPVPRRLLPAVYKVLARGMAAASGAGATATDGSRPATGPRQNMIKPIVEVARQIKADQEPVSLGQLHDAYLQAFPGIGKGMTRPSFAATVNFYTINMRSRFIDKSDWHKPAPWLAQPTFKRVGRGQYMLLSSDEIARFRQAVNDSNSLVYTDEYDVDALAPGQ